MNDKNNVSMSNMTDEQLANLYEEYAGFGFESNEIPEPEPEIVEEIPEEIPETTTKLTLKLFKEEVNEDFKLPILYEAMKEAFDQTIEGDRLSVIMANAHLLVKTDNEVFGNFNGAGPIAVTMFNPEHPDAPKSGKNYGKVFYHWDDDQIMELLDAIFETYGLDPQIALEEKKARDAKKAQEEA